MIRARSLPSTAALVGNSSDEMVEDAVFRKISWRVMPLILVAYVCAFLDGAKRSGSVRRALDKIGFNDLPVAP